MKTKHYSYYVFVTEDGIEFKDQLAALEHESTIAKIKEIEFFLGGKQHQKVIDSKGYYQHNKTDVAIAWERTIEISKKYFKGYNQLLNVIASEIHPMGLGGRIISECGNLPLNKLWWRFSCIDSKSKEWNQPYYALNKGTGPDICINK